MFKRVSFTLILAVGLLLFIVNWSSEGSYNEHKLVTWVVHYYDSAGDFCRITKREIEVPILNSHYEQYHTAPPPNGGRIPGKEDHQNGHGSTATVFETVVDEITDPDADCYPYGN